MWFFFKEILVSVNKKVESFLVFSILYNLQSPRSAMRCLSSCIFCKYRIHILNFEPFRPYIIQCAKLDRKMRIRVLRRVTRYFITSQTITSKRINHFRKILFWQRFAQLFFTRKNNHIHCTCIMYMKLYYILLT